MSAPDIAAIEREQAEVFLAWKRGETIQAQRWSDLKWMDIAPCDPIPAQCKLRRKPQPKLRRWKPEEIPVGALIRTKGDARVNLILSRDTAGFKVCSHGSEPVLVDVLASELRFEEYEFSKDLGATWLPVGVVE